MELYERELALVKKVLKENPKGMTVSDISREIRINRNSVAKYLDVLLISGRVEMRTIGPAKVFSLSHRTPLSALLNFSSDYILVLDKDLKIVQVNDRIVDFIKIGKESLVGHNIKDCKSSPLNAPEMLSKIKGALEGKQFSMEKDFKFNGNFFYFRVKLVPTTFDDGEPGITMIMEDITERKRAENELRIRNRAIETSVNGMAFSDLDGNLTYVNPSFLEMWGYSSGKEIIGKNAAEFWQTKEKVRNVMESLRKNGEWLGELVAKRKNGSLFDVHLSASIVKDRNGKPISLMASFIDITKRKKAEEATKISEKRYRLLFDTSPVGIGIADLEGNVLASNRVMEEMTGYTKEELRKLKLESTYVDLDERRRMLGVLRESGRVRDYEVRLKRKNGEVYTALLNIDVVELEGQKVLLTTSRDITEQKRAEGTLHESEEKFRTIFENVNDMIIYLDKRGKILDINKKVEDALGYRRGEVIGKSFAKIGVFGAKDLPRILRLFTDMLRGDRTVDVMELYIRDRKGNRVPIEANVKIVKREGETEGVVVILRKTKGNQAEVIS